MNLLKRQREELFARALTLLLNIQHLELDFEHKKEWDQKLLEEYEKIMQLHAHWRIMESLVGNERNFKRSCGSLPVSEHHAK